MNILVPTKRVPDTDQKIRVSSDATTIDDAAIPYVINPFDAIALEEALRIRESRSETTQVVAVGIGGADYEQELRTALAMGADRAVRVGCDAALDPWNVAVVLEALAQRESPDMILMGKQAVDDDSNQVGQFLAARLDWPQATFASRVELAEGELLVDRETDLGTESITVSLPAVVTCDLRLNEPRYASLPSILKSKKKPIEQISLEELAVSIDSRVEVISLEATSSSRNCQYVTSATELITKLRDDAECL